jgi:hypothetical protein
MIDQKEREEQEREEERERNASEEARAKREKIEERRRMIEEMTKKNLDDIAAKKQAKKDKDLKEQQDKEKQDKFNQKLKEKLLKARIANKEKAEKEKAERDKQEVNEQAANAQMKGGLKSTLRTPDSKLVRSEQKTKLSKDAEGRLSAKRKSIASTHLLEGKQQDKSNLDRNPKGRNSPAPDRPSTLQGQQSPKDKSALSGGGPTQKGAPETGRKTQQENGRTSPKEKK